MAEPLPGPTAPTDYGAVMAQAIADAQAQQGGASAKDRPLVPLWMTRPKGAGPRPPLLSSPGGPRRQVDMLKRTPSSGAGSANAAERAAEGNAMPDPVTASIAESHWADMTEQERMQFAAEAEKAGMWKKSQGGFALFTTWSKAVELAATYNQNKPQDKWVSPFEAVTKLSINALANDDQAHDGFSTQSSVQQFNEMQLRSSARQVLQSELGRNPTDSEMRAYTAAVNEAARRNPQTVMQQQTDNPDGSTSTSQVQSGGIDPQSIIQDMVKNTDEHDQFQAAAMYFPAAMSALNAVV